MPLTQPLPTTWTNQHVIADTSNSNIAANDYLISNSGAKYGTTGKTYLPLKMPFATFYMTNQATGTVLVVISRAVDGVPLYATVVAAVTDADGNQVRIITLPVDDPSGLTITTTKTGTVSFSCVVSGVTDSGLLPLNPSGSPGTLPSANQGGIGPNYFAGGTGGGPEGPKFAGPGGGR